MAAGFSKKSPSIGRWQGDRRAVATSHPAMAAMLHRVHATVFVVELDGKIAFVEGGQALVGTDEGDGLPLLAIAPPGPASRLGDPLFAQSHGLRLNYVAGAMAGGIASVELVETMARGGMLGMYGAAGLDLATVETGLARLSTNLLDRPWGTNLIHSPYEPELERGIVDLYLRRGVRRISASAYLDLTLPLLRYRLHGVRRAADGTVIAPNRVLAKISRVEVAEKFLKPAPEPLLRALVEAGDLDPEAAKLAENLPVASDLIVEADSGGHTDNRPALTLLPTMIGLRDRIAAEQGYLEPPRIGAAGGIGTPHAAAAAFAMGAAFVVTGTVNQACLEAGTSDTVRAMLADAGQADVAMAPAADMFEMGVELQVLRRGTLFPMRARKLWDLYRANASLETIAADERGKLERTIFRASIDEIWAQTRTFWDGRDPTQVQRAEADPKHRMALCFRWYLGQASRWANAGIADRKPDYQIWCGPAIGAFNEWTRDTFLESWQDRRAVPVALNLMHGAAVLGRAASLRTQGVVVPPALIDTRPRPIGELEEFAQ